MSKDDKKEPPKTRLGLGLLGNDADAVADADAGADAGADADADAVADAGADAVAPGSPSPASAMPGEAAHPVSPPRIDVAFSTTTPDRVPVMSRTLESPGTEPVAGEAPVLVIRAASPEPLERTFESTVESPQPDDLPRPMARPARPTSPPFVFVDAVHARDRSAPGGKARGAVSGVSVALGAGVHVILGTPLDGTVALAEVLAAERAPLRGRLVISGRSIADDARMRARVGSLGAEPRLPPARTVTAAVRLALRARGEDGDRAHSILDPFGLAPLASRRPASLSFPEARAVDLALALSTPAPLLLALHEPFADVALAPQALVEARVRELADAGTCVVVTTSSPTDARKLADRVYLLQRGRLALEAATEGLLDLGAGVELQAWVALAGARKLAEALSRSRSVQAVAWEEQAGRGVVRFRGVDPDECALALAEASATSDVTVEMLAPFTPSLDEVRGATWSLLQMSLQQGAARR